MFWIIRAGLQQGASYGSVPAKRNIDGGTRPFEDRDPVAPRGIWVEHYSSVQRGNTIRYMERIMNIIKRRLGDNQLSRPISAIAACGARTLAPLMK